MSKMKTTLISSLEKIYTDKDLSEQRLLNFSMLKNERKSFQIAVECDTDLIAEIKVSSDFNYNIYSVEKVKSDYPADRKAIDSYSVFSDDGYYYDLLMPISNSYSFKKGINIIWFEIISNETLTSGKQNIKIDFVSEKEAISEESLCVEIINQKLDFKDFVYTNWFHTDCLMSHYKIEAFSDEYWRIVKNYLKVAAEYGMNCVLTPIFTPPLDTEIGKERPTVQLVDVTLRDNKYSFNFEKLEKWIEISTECGIKYFEMSHFYTQWGARRAPKIMATVNGEYKRIFGWETKANSKEYKRFLTEFSVEFKKFIENKALKEKVLLHVSDEPNFSMIIPYYKASKMIHKLYDGYKIVDALSEYILYKLGIVSTPIPSNDAVNKFIGKTDELWTYYCSAQQKNYVSNRLFCMPSLRNRIIGFQMYKYNVKGFLHWGYNFWYTQYSKSLINPFEVTDAGGKFPSGDSFVVYPADDGTPYQSLRLKVFFDGLQDMAALNTLEKLTDRKTALNILENNSENEITFNDYPHYEEWLLNTREKINLAIKNAERK